MFSRQRRIWSFHVAVLKRTQHKCTYTKNYNACARLLSWSLNLLFGDLSVAFAAVYCARALLKWWRRSMLPLFNYGPRRKAGPRKISLQTHSSCSPPRKSLVKGERFVRVEGKPELPCYWDNGCFVEQNAPKRVGPLIYRLQIRMRLFNMCSLRRNSE